MGGAAPRAGARWKGVGRCQRTGQRSLDDWSTTDPGTVCFGYILQPHLAVGVPIVVTDRVNRVDVREQLLPPTKKRDRSTNVSPPTSVNEVRSSFIRFTCGPQRPPSCT